MLLSGAGTGAIYLLRWFWYRINAWTEIAAMLAASVVAVWIIVGPGDDGVKSWITDWKMPIQLLCVFLGCVAVYSLLFAVGNFIYGNLLGGALMSVLVAGAMGVLFRSFGKLGAE